MNCKQVQEQMLDVAAAPEAKFPAAHQHVRGCAECARRLEALRHTMAALDGWTAPEPSPFFMARLHAQLREEAERPQTWRERLWQLVALATLPARKTATALAMVLLVASAVLLYQGGRPSPAPGGRGAQVMAGRGSAVGDLLTLDKDKDLYAEFDLLDDTEAKGSATP